MPPATSLKLILINQLVDAADTTIFPVLYKSISTEFGIGPSTLGLISLGQTLARSLSCPLWGYFSDKISKRNLLVFGVCIWSTATILSGLATSIIGFSLARILCGLGLGCVSPVIQALVAESHSKRLGYSFGLLSIAGMIGAFLGTSLGNHVAWRACFLLLGMLSLLLAWVDFKYISNRSASHSKRTLLDTNLSIRQLFAEMFIIFKSSSMRIIMLQGVIGSMPWVAMNYTNMYLQNVGLSASRVSILQAAFTFSVGLGGFAGGMIGDYMHSKFPFMGRVVTAQVSVFLGIPIVAHLFTIPPNPDFFSTYLALLICLGLCCSWCSSGCNRPLFCDIVPIELRATAISWVVAVDDSLSGVMAPIVGVMAESYGFVKGQSSLENAEALRKSLFISMVYPRVVCLLSYTLLYKTYSKEVAKNKRRIL